MTTSTVSTLASAASIPFYESVGRECELILPVLSKIVLVRDDLIDHLGELIRR